MNGTEARVGLLYFGSRRAALDGGRHEALLQGLRELGWREGKGLAIEARFADGSTERLGLLASVAVIADPDSDAHAAQMARIAAAAHSLPAFAEVGGLLGYGHELRESFRRAAFYVDRILKGARPGELPFEQPTRNRLAVNLKTAGSLGLSIPRSLLSRADRVIE